MRELSLEARRHPDVREVYPHLVGLQWESRRVEYDRDEVLALFRAAWGDEPFLPVREVFTKGTRDWIDWKSWDLIAAFESGEISCIMPSERRSGVADTIRWLAFEGLPEDDWAFEGPKGDDRICLALSAILADIGTPYVSEDGHIVAAIITKLGNTLFDSGYQWHHRCSAFVPWRLGLRLGVRDLCGEVNTLADLMNWLVKTLKDAQSEGTLVHVIGRPPEGREDELRGKALEATRKALVFMEQGQWSEASGQVFEANHKLNQASECEAARARPLADDS